ncbi:ADR407Cp [Eremothecium gossypii ATCC 10895]|uniref:ADR407Cp n=1 Tax=Eremothecium gossypii (strain ATCC 10895 / CBS 109.51 / FGSC 9923 / NRRL Y-1056) TaxID=284811 RepID=Q758X1_EREGS|nr:ADR407Cp [Eremothecium gossypii ATCC 10895]AAS52326.2 ADR407Cp [Eremothecium gossypii ATCC 10895]
MKQFLAALGWVMWALMAVQVGAIDQQSSGATSNDNAVPRTGYNLRASSLLTCMENSQFQALKFDVNFNLEKRRVDFNIDATTTITDKVVAQVQVTAYGLNVLEKTLDFCSLNIPALCELHAGRINVESHLEISDDDIIKKIPKVAYIIPDLDARVVVKAFAKADTSYEHPMACVQAVLSNGKTVQTKYASWPIAAIAGVGVLTSGFVSVIGHSTTAAHIASNSISLFSYFQNLAITSMMGVARVPPIAAAWSQNFQWSMGIIKVGFMQNIFQWYVQATGGTPVVVVAHKDLLSVSVQRRRMKRAMVRGANFVYEKLTNFVDQMRTEPVKQVTVSTSSDVNFDNTLKDSTIYMSDERDTESFFNKILVLHGIQRVAFKAGIELSNVFLTGICFFLFFVVVVVISLAAFKAIVELLTRFRMFRESTKFVEYRRCWAHIIKGTLFRIAIIAFPQVSLLSIWEFTQADSPALVVDAVVILLVVGGVLFYGASRVILRGRESTRLYKTPAYLLYGDFKFLNRFGFLYVQFKASSYWWLIPLLGYYVLRSLFVAVLQDFGKAQVVVVFAVELVYFVALCIVRPYLDKRTNSFNIAIHFINLLNAFFFLFFSNIFRQPQVVSSVLSVVMFAVNALFALFLLVFTIVTCLLALLHRNPDARYEPMKDDRVSFIPKISGKGQSEKELVDLSKAVMISNETDAEKHARGNALARQGDGNRRVVFDDGLDDVVPGSRQVEIQPVQPRSAMGGPDVFRPGYQSVPTAPSTGSDSRSSGSTAYQDTDMARDNLYGVPGAAHSSASYGHQGVPGPAAARNPHQFHGTQNGYVQQQPHGQHGPHQQYSAGRNYGSEPQYL